MAASISEAVLRKWMDELGPRLITLSTGICRDRHRAEEIVQEAFIKLWRKPPDAGEVVFPAWMRKVVTNLSINALQRTRRAQALPEFSTDPALRSPIDTDKEREAQEELERVHAAMNRLDPQKRAILLLRAVEELSYEDIAQHLGIPVGTVMSRLNRARAALQEEMNRMNEAANEQPDVYEFKKYKHG